MTEENNLSFYTILYGLSSTGKPKQWAVSVKTFDKYSEIIVDHGYVNGKIVSSSRKLEVGKNIGKSNETTHLQQAILEAKALVEKKRDEQYVSSIDLLKTAEEVEIPLPMLAHEYSKRKKYINFPCLVQPKLNGVRCIISKNNGKCTAYSRGGKKYSVIKHILDFCNEHMANGDIFDGEIFNRDLTFQEIVTAIKNEDEVDVNLDKLQYWVYDYVSNENYKDRLAHIYDTFSMPVGVCVNTPIVLTPTFIVDDEDEIFVYHAKFVADMYEGTMIRNYTGKYDLKHRSNNLLKYKDFLESEFEIVGGEEGDGLAKGQCIFICRLSKDDPRTFKVRCVGDNASREEQFRNLENYKTKWLTVKYQTFSDDGIPIFPVGIIIRDGIVNDGKFEAAE